MLLALGNGSRIYCSRFCYCLLFHNLFCLCHVVGAGDADVPGDRKRLLQTSSRRSAQQALDLPQELLQQREMRLGNVSCAHPSPLLSISRSFYDVRAWFLLLGDLVVYYFACCASGLPGWDKFVVCVVAVACTWYRISFSVRMELFVGLNASLVPAWYQLVTFTKWSETPHVVNRSEIAGLVVAFILLANQLVLCSELKSGADDLKWIMNLHVSLVLDTWTNLQQMHNNINCPCHRVTGQS